MGVGLPLPYGPGAGAGSTGSREPYDVVMDTLSVRSVGDVTVAANGSGYVCVKLDSTPPVVVGDVVATFPYGAAGMDGMKVVGDEVVLYVQDVRDADLALEWFLEGSGGQHSGLDQIAARSNELEASRREGERKAQGVAEKLKIPFGNMG